MTTSPKRAAKVEQIHDVAARLFAKKGFHSTRMEEIAAGLGLQKGALYYYFDSKESLLASLVETRVGVALEVLEEIVRRDTSATERVRAAFLGHLTVFQEHADLYTIFNSERLHVIDAGAAAKVNRLGREFEHLWASLLEEGKRTGEFSADLDTGITVKAALGACNMTLTWFKPGGRLTIEHVADRFSGIFLKGILTA